jgi:manganese/iron transport system substrate-binding protein
MSAWERVSEMVHRSARHGLVALMAPLLALIVALAAGCADDNASDGDGQRLHAVTTLEILADLARQVGGDRVEVTALLPTGADPHTFELVPARVADVARSDVAFANGLGLEGNVLDVIRENAGGPTVELADGLTTLDDNPHLWLDVRLAARYVERIRDTFTLLDPTGRAEYEANASAYLEELGDLDREIEAGVESIPPENRKLVTFHDAFPYLAARYGLEVVAVVVPSPGQEPSARQVAELVETLSTENVPAVFKEPQFNADVLELAADEAGVRVLSLLSGAYAEGVDSYIELMRFNLRQLQEGLGGS